MFIVLSLLFLIFYSMIVNINKLFLAVNKLFWVLFKDHKSLKYKAQIVVTISFFIIDPKGVKLGRGQGLLSNRLVPDSTNPIFFIFTMKKCESLHKNNFDFLVKKHYDSFKHKINNLSPQLPVDRDTLVEFKGFDYFIKTK